MSVNVVIPARHASVRYPGKPLAQLSLPDGTRQSLVRLTWEAARAIPGVESVHVATDDTRIRDHCESFGAQVVMTEPACRNGTERVAEAARIAGLTSGIIVNLQGDAPLTPPWFVEALVAAMTADPSIEMATPVLRCDATMLGHLMDDRQAGRVGATTAVFDRMGDALYFSKSLLPYLDRDTAGAAPPVWHHVGVYAYTPAALAAYCDWPAGRLEGIEGLEQLRFLENGHKVRCVEVDPRDAQFWELNNPEDVARIEAVLRARG